MISIAKTKATVVSILGNYGHRVNEVYAEYDERVGYQECVVIEFTSNNGNPYKLEIEKYATGYNYVLNLLWEVGGEFILSTTLETISDVVEKINQWDVEN